MEAISDKQPIILTAQERKRLADYLDVLIEMHFEYKRNYKGSNNDEENELINLKPIGKTINTRTFGTDSEAL